MDKTNDNCIVKKEELIDLLKIEKVDYITFTCVEKHIRARIVATEINDELREKIKNLKYIGYPCTSNQLIIDILI